MSYLKGGRIHPALILAGPQKEAKFQVAKNLAKFLLCQKKTAGSFCGKCSPCRRIEAEIHPDVLILREPDEDTIKIDTIREICHQMEISPIEAAAKICIIDECHRMTVASSNAFLKTLEEPGQSRYFWLLTTQPGALIPTILSRCLQFQFKPESAVEGAPTEASQEAFQLLEEFLKAGDIAALRSKLEDKGRCLFFLQSLQRAVRDALLAPSLGTPSPVSALGRYSPFSLLSKFNEAVVLEGQLRSNANYGLMLESFLIRNF